MKKLKSFSLTLFVFCTLLPTFSSAQVYPVRNSYICQNQTHLTDFHKGPVISNGVDTAWVRRYNGPGNSADLARAIAVDGVGNVYVTGSSAGSGTSADYATIKYNSAGDTVWTRRCNGQGNSNDEASAIAVDDAGNVYVTGCSYDASTEFDYMTIKYNSAGDTVWTRRYNGPGNGIDLARAITVDAAYNVYTTGYSYDSSTSWDYTTIKYSSAGLEQWVRRYNGPGNDDDYAQSIAVDGLAYVYVTGSSAGSGTSADYATIKYNSAGDTVWVRRYNGPGNGHDQVNAMAIDGSGNIYVTGVSYDSSTGYDFATIKYNSAGDTVWVRRYNGPGNSGDWANAIAVDGSGNTHITGWSYNSSTGDDYVTLKCNSVGETLWVRRYNGPGNDADAAYAVAIDGSGSVYVTGESYDSGTGQDYATIMYNSTGVEQWVARYGGRGWDAASAIALDGRGNVYVTGFGYDSTTSHDYATIKYVQTGGIEENSPVRPSARSISISPLSNPTRKPVFLYNLPYGNSQATITIYDCLGNIVKTVQLSNSTSEGMFIWNKCDRAGKKISSGVYFVKIKSGTSSCTAKMLLLQ